MHGVGGVYRRPFDPVLLPLRLCSQLCSRRLVWLLILRFVHGHFQAFAIDNEVYTTLGFDQLLSPLFDRFGN